MQQQQQQHVGKQPNTNTHKRARRTAGDGAEPLLARGVPNLQLDPFVVEEHLLDLEVDPVLVVVLEKGVVLDSFQALWTKGCAHTHYAHARSVLPSQATAAHCVRASSIYHQTNHRFCYAPPPLTATRTRAHTRARAHTSAKKRRQTHPMVVMKLGVKLSSENRSSRQLFPTPFVCC